MVKEQDLNILVMLGSTRHPDEVEQERQRLCEKKEKHGGTYGSDYADEQSTKWLAVSIGQGVRNTSAAFSAPFEPILRTRGDL